MRAVAVAEEEEGLRLLHLRMARDQLGCDDEIGALPPAKLVTQRIGDAELTARIPIGRDNWSIAVALRKGISSDTDAVTRAARVFYNYIHTDLLVRVPCAGRGGCPHVASDAIDEAGNDHTHHSQFDGHIVSYTFTTSGFSRKIDRLFAHPEAPDFEERTRAFDFFAVSSSLEEADRARLFMEAQRRASYNRAAFAAPLLSLVTSSSMREPLCIPPHAVDAARKSDGRFPICSLQGATYYCFQAVPAALRYAGVHGFVEFDYTGATGASLYKHLAEELKAPRLDISDVRRGLEEDSALRKRAVHPGVVEYIAFLARVPHCAERM
jgi:hypothetical protein